MRLWLSYQRYGLLMASLSLAAMIAVVVCLPMRWWPAWIPVFALGLTLLAAAREILGRYPRKLRATFAAQRRIESGRFRPEFVRAYCGDPCFRVVAREILTRAQIAPRERRALIERFTAALEEESKFVVLVDRTAGTVVRVDGRGSVEIHGSP